MINANELIKYIENNINEPSNITISKIASHFYIAPTTVYRMSLALGYENFTSFKIDIISKYRLYNNTNLQVKESSVVNNNNIIDFIKAINRTKKVYIYDKFGVNSRIIAQTLIYKGFEVILIYNKNMIKSNDGTILSFENDINNEDAFFLNLEATDNNLINLVYDACQKPLEISLIEVYESILTLLNLK